jgi:hypothetical protein
MNPRLLAVVAVLVLAIVGTATWFLNSQPPPPPLAGATATPAPAVNEPDTRARLATNTPQPEPVPPTDEDRPAVVPEPRNPNKPMADWELKIDKILQTNADETQMAQMLINMLPTLPPEGQAEAAQHISNLILDKDYSRVLPLVKNPGLPEDTLDVFVTDLMNREDTVKLPALLEIAKIPNHPHREEAATDLQIFLDEDYGTDWGKWDAAMKAYLKKQAEENAAAENESANPPSLPRITPPPVPRPQ